MRAKSTRKDEREEGRRRRTVCVCETPPSIRVFVSNSCESYMDEGREKGIEQEDTGQGVQEAAERLMQGLEVNVRTARRYFLFCCSSVNFLCAH